MNKKSSNESNARLKKRRAITKIYIDESIKNKKVLFYELPEFL